MKTTVVKIGNVKIGGGNPIVIQSMTNTDTSDAKATAAQCMELANAGAEIVRVTVNDEVAAKTIPKIRKILDKKGYKNLPLVGDFHFNGHKLLSEFPECAKILDKYRINPGNVGQEENFATIIKIAKKYQKSVRIGANWGSLDQNILTKLMNKYSGEKSEREIVIEAMVESVLSSAKFAEKLGLPHSKIVLSVKMSEVKDVVEAYKKLTKKMAKHPYALHLGLTEAGPGTKGIISSSAALAILLQEGIGDTIRISLTPLSTAMSAYSDIAGSTRLNKTTAAITTSSSQSRDTRTQEVEACKILLQSLGLRQFQSEIISCPGCGRTNNKLFQKIVTEVSTYIEAQKKQIISSNSSNQLDHSAPSILSITNNPAQSTKSLKIAIMGCIVNGPGEARHADIALILPGKTETPIAQVYKKGKFIKNLTGKNIAQEFLKIIFRDIP